MAKRRKRKKDFFSISPPKRRKSKNNYFAISKTKKRKKQTSELDAAMGVIILFLLIFVVVIYCLKKLYVSAYIKILVIIDWIKKNPSYFFLAIIFLCVIVGLIVLFRRKNNSEYQSTDTGILFDRNNQTDYISADISEQGNSDLDSRKQKLNTTNPINYIHGPEFNIEHGFQNDIKEQVKTINFENRTYEINNCEESGFEIDLIKEEHNHKYSFDKIDKMGGEEFEDCIAELLKLKGYIKVITTPSTGDHGVDIIAERDSIKYAIQCKRYAKKVGNKSVQEVYSGKAFYDADVAIVITNNYFTDQAKQEARKLEVKLWDRRKVERLLNSNNVNN